MIDERHHLKCKRKRLREGRHDEVPPAGALGETRSALPLSLPLSPTPRPLLLWSIPPSFFLPFKLFSPLSLPVHLLLSPPLPLSLRAPTSPSPLLFCSSHFCPPAHPFPSLRHFLHLSSPPFICRSYLFFCRVTFPVPPLYSQSYTCAAPFAGSICPRRPRKCFTPVAWSS